jgi:hypothetical protein
MEGSTPGYLEEIKKYLWRNPLLAKASKNSYHESTIEHEITVKKNHKTPKENEPPEKIRYTEAEEIGMIQHKK